MNKPDKVCLVVPCYNEATILADTVNQLQQKLGELIELGLATADSMMLLVDDGSSDDTWKLISAAHAKTPGQVFGLKLACNQGHQAALLAGLLQARHEAEITISLDADLQDDIGVLKDFLEEYYRGSDIVYGVRSDRSQDSFFKRFTAENFYRFQHMLGVKTIYNHADFRLMSRRAVDALAQYREVNLYLRGLVPLIGFRQSIVLYQRKATSRPTHYPLTKMLRLAWDGITSFSVRPIRLITVVGFLMFLLSMALLVYFLFVKFFGYTVEGWTSLIFVTLLLGGIQLLSIGIIGEYIAKTYIEVKARPRFTVQEYLDKGDKRP
jgi:glycosyltransferase involved in cell wall biosynthesis